MREIEEVAGLAVQVIVLRDKLAKSEAKDAEFKEWQEVVRHINRQVLDMHRRLINLEKFTGVDPYPEKSK
jgi:hypothetical protein